jgi:hypothetical protein
MEIDHPLCTAEDHVGADSSGSKAATSLMLYDEGPSSLQIQQVYSETVQSGSIRKNPLFLWRSQKLIASESCERATKLKLKLRPPKARFTTCFAPASPTHKPYLLYSLKESGQVTQPALYKQPRPPTSSCTYFVLHFTHQHICSRHVPLPEQAPRGAVSLQLILYSDDKLTDFSTESNGVAIIPSASSQNPSAHRRTFWI